MKISIVVPIYNIEKYINRCVDSIIKQTYQEIEIILVDDGSKDNSAKICDEYAKIDNRIKVIHKENGGLSDARNIGLKVASGEYIMYIDGDDSIVPTACEELVQIVKKYNADIVCFNLNLINEDTKKIKKDSFYNYTNTKNVKELTFKEAIEDNINRISIRYEAPSKIYKKSILEKHEFPIGMYAEDFATFYKFLKESKSIIYYDANLYNYFMRNNSIMGSKNVKLYIDIYEIELEFYSAVLNLDLNNETRKKLEDNHFKILIKSITKLILTKDDKYTELQNKIYDDIINIDKKMLSVKMKVLLFLFKVNRKLGAGILNRMYKKL